MTGDKIVRNEELIFANTNEAIQHLADLTDSRIVIAADADPLKIPDDLRNDVNQSLNKEGFDGNKSFENMSKATYAIEEVLSRFQLAYNEDTSAGKFSGLNGQKLVKIAQKNPEDSLSPTPIENAVIEIDWSPMGDTKEFSVTAYMS